MEHPQEQVSSEQASSEGRQCPEKAQKPACTEAKAAFTFTHQKSTNPFDWHDNGYQRMKEVYEFTVKNCDFSAVKDMSLELYLHDTFGCGFSERGENEWLHALDFVEKACKYIHYLVGVKVDQSKNPAHQPDFFIPDVDISPLTEDDYNSRFLMCFTLSLSDPRNVAVALHMNIVVRLVSLLRLYADSPLMIASGFRCLARLSRLHKDQVDNSELPLLIGKYMAIYKDHKGVVHSAIKVMNNVGYNSVTQPLKSTFCELLVHAFKHFDDNPFIQRSAAHTLISDIHPLSSRKPITERVQMIQEYDIGRKAVRKCYNGHITISLTDKFCARCNGHLLDALPPTQNSKTTQQITITSPHYSEKEKNDPSKCLGLPFFDPPHTAESYKNILMESTNLYPELIVMIVNYLYVSAEVGLHIDVLDCVNRWCLAQITAVCPRSSRIRVHYLYYGEKWDEWLSSDASRIAEAGTYTGVVKKYESCTRQLKIRRESIIVERIRSTRKQ